MISERAAIARPGALRARPRTSLRDRLIARPSLAGRERLGEAIGQSFLVQLALAMTFVAVAALLYMAQASQVSVQQININTLRGDRAVLVVANANQRALATSLQGTQRIQAAAIQQHLTVPNSNSTIWLNPIVPRVAPVRPVGADAAAARNDSQPLAWMSRALDAVRSSL